MKQMLKQITNEELQKLNQQGWFIKQVIERNKGGMLCEDTYYYVLLEKEDNKDD